jgi:hypothetical protein
MELCHRLKTSRYLWSEKVGGLNQADAKAEEKGLKIIFGLILLWSESGGCESRREGGNCAKLLHS